MPAPAGTVSPTSLIPDTLDRHVTETPLPAATLDSGLLNVLRTVPDPRDPRGLRYPMAMLPAMAILATAAGMRGFTGYASWARNASPEVLAALGLAKRYRPRDKTFRRGFALLDPADLDRCLGAYFTVAALATAATSLVAVAVAVDGKTLRLAKRMGAAAVRLVAPRRLLRGPHRRHAAGHGSHS
ncbi:transposase family protein [Nocardia brasiliensis]|uniref:transposase family protein n=1 Tax=Nocardia brasiliensis TaxID=37326 RepID=UPI0023B07720|nr:transposase family protein [Nocardia brasiliensis]